MELILRNACIIDRNKARLDIGIDWGRIAAIEPRLAAEARESDLEGRLVSPGFVETHKPLLNRPIAGQQPHRNVAEMRFVKGPFRFEDHLWLIA